MAASRVALVQEPFETSSQLDRPLKDTETTKLTPVGQLAMPNQSMTSQLLAIFSSKFGNLISFGIGEFVFRGLGFIPLATISEGSKQHGKACPTFCALPGVIAPKSSVLLSWARYGASVNWLLLVAAPKYSFPFETAAVFKPAP